MGSKNSRKELPEHLHEKVLKLFNLIDVDGSKTIDKQETLKFWSTEYAKLNTKELFDQVDINNDGSIQLNEWVDFWTTVYNAGHDEEEISKELDNMIAGKSWVKFSNVDQSKGKTNDAKKHGKY